MLKSDKIYIAGHRGLVGSAIIRSLEKQEYNNIIYASHQELDLRNQNATFEFFEKNKPDYVFLAAAKVGGIYANNTYPAEFIYDNLQIECNIIHAAYEYEVKKLQLLGSSCIYPKYAPQPIKEEHLMTGALEPTNAPYGLAKIAGIMMCESYNRQYNTNFISCMPTNLYGIGDSYHPKNSHVLPALIRRIHEAKVAKADKVVIWGTGNPLREFLYVDDLADACIFLMQKYKGNETINVGSGTEVKIYDLAVIIKEVLEYNGEIITDPSKPDGTPRKFIDSSKIYNLGWKPKIKLRDGIRKAYEDFLNRFGNTNG